MVFQRGYFSLLGMLLTAEIFRRSNCQCFTSTDCTGGRRVPPLNSLKECCVNTDDGQSWENNDGSCTRCIVHGFNSTKYHVSEGATLVFEVMLLVKGEVDPDQLSALSGVISTQSITAREDADYIPFSRISTNQISAGHSLTYSLMTLEDAISSECEEQVLLVYTPSRPYFIHVLEIVGHLVRENAIVIIEDDNTSCDGIESLSPSITLHMSPTSVQLAPASTTVQTPHMTDFKPQPLPTPTGAQRPSIPSIQASLPSKTVQTPLVSPPSTPPLVISLNPVVSGRSVEVHVEASKDVKIRVIMRDSSSQRQRQNFIGTSGTITFTNLPVGPGYVRAVARDNDAGKYDTGWIAFVVN